MNLRTVHALRTATAVLVALALAGCTMAREPQARSAPAPVTAAAPRANASTPAAATGDIPAIVRKVEPSVVTISHDQGTGSGVVWSKDGVVVTNAHVVGSVQQVEVAFFDGRRAEGRVRATDPDTDLAVVDVERRDLKPATFQKALPAVGELAVAMGSPLGFQNTITAGIISGLHREIPGSADQGIRSLVDLIQTDAAARAGRGRDRLRHPRGDRRRRRRPAPAQRAGHPQLPRHPARPGHPRRRRPARPRPGARGGSARGGRWRPGGQGRPAAG
jgi:S1-C subfamily serine protease